MFLRTGQITLLYSTIKLYNDAYHVLQVEVKCRVMERGGTANTVQYPGELTENMAEKNPTKACNKAKLHKVTNDLGEAT